MGPPKRTPATAMTGALESQADKLSPRAKPKNADKQELLDRLDVLEVLSKWRIELQAKLARKEIIFLYANTDTDFGPLADEVRDFVRVSKMLRWARRQAP
jgi:hypothetical protein